MSARIGPIETTRSWAGASSMRFELEGFLCDWHIPESALDALAKTRYSAVVSDILLPHFEW